MKTPSPKKATSYADVIRRLFPFAKPYYKLIIISLLLTVAGASFAQVTPVILKYIVDQVTSYIETQSSLDFLRSVLIWGCIGLIVKELLVLVINYYVGYFGELLKVKIGADLSNAVFVQLLGLDLSYYDQEKNEVGRLIKRIDKGVDVLAKTIKNLFVDIIPLIFNATVSLIVMYSVNFWVGITATLIVPVYFYLSYLQAQKQRGVRYSIQEISENRTASMLSVLGAIKLVISFQRERLEAERLKATNTKLASQEGSHHQTNRIFDGWKFFFDRLGAVLIVLVTVFLVISGNASVGAIMLHLLLYDNIAAPIRHLHRIYDETNEAVTFADGFFEILNAKPTLLVNSPINVNNLKIAGSLQLHDVDFSYHEGHQVLHKINLVIPAQKTVALVGLSGAGKTTIANLLGRFYDPTQGMVTLDGIDLKNYPLEFVHQTTGYVLQDGHIFPGSISDNIRYGKIDATLEEIIGSAKQAGLHQDISRMPNGYDSNATKLSGGQKQRISIARLFLKNPPILILDEPTASLDAITTEKIQAALRTLRNSRSVLIISHNLASVIDADIIYVINDGKIIGVGDHQTLYKENEYYRNLIDANIEAMNLERLISVRNSS